MQGGCEVLRILLPHPFTRQVPDHHFKTIAMHVNIYLFFEVILSNFLIEIEKPQRYAHL